MSLFLFKLVLFRWVTCDKRKWMSMFHGKYINVLIIYEKDKKDSFVVKIV